MCVGSNGFNESEVLAKYEIMDGLPVRGCLLIVLVLNFI